MQQQGKQDTVPFLLAQATFVPGDAVQTDLKPDNNETKGGFFHTRCGHPRRRDD